MTSIRFKGPRKNDFPLSATDASRLAAFITAPRRGTGDHVNTQFADHRPKGNIGSLLQDPARREVSCGLRSEGTPLLRLGLTKQALSHPQ